MTRHSLLLHGYTKNVITVYYHHKFYSADPNTMFFNGQYIAVYVDSWWSMNTSGYMGCAVEPPLRMLMDANLS